MYRYCYFCSSHFNFLTLTLSFFPILTTCMMEREFMAKYIFLKIYIKYLQISESLISCDLYYKYTLLHYYIIYIYTQRYILLLTVEKRVKILWELIQSEKNQSSIEFDILTEKKVRHTYKHFVGSPSKQKFDSKYAFSLKIIWFGTHFS